MSKRISTAVFCSIFSLATPFSLFDSSGSNDQILIANQTPMLKNTIFHLARIFDFLFQYKLCQKSKTEFCHIKKR